MQTSPLKNLLKVGSWLIFLLCASASTLFAETAGDFFKDRFKLKFGAESRYRFEYKDDFNFNDSAYEDDAINLFRNRLSADLSVKKVRGFVEVQDAVSFAQSSLNKTSLNVNRFDLRQFFLEANSPWSEIPVSLKVGRQELS